MQIAHIGYTKEMNDKLDALFNHWLALDTHADALSYENAAANDAAEVAWTEYQKAADAARAAKFAPVSPWETGDETDPWDMGEDDRWHLLDMVDETHDSFLMDARYG